MTETPDPLLVSITDTCTMLSLSRPTVEKLVRDGKLKQVKIGRRTLIQRPSIDEYVAGL